MEEDKEFYWFFLSNIPSTDKKWYVGIKILLKQSDIIIQYTLINLYIVYAHTQCEYLLCGYLGEYYVKDTHNIT